MIRDFFVRRAVIARLESGPMAAHLPLLASRPGVTTGQNYMLRKMSHRQAAENRGLLQVTGFLRDRPLALVFDHA